MTTTNHICRLFNIEFPIVQAGMVWCSGWRLASAVSNAGGLGLIGSGSMPPEVLREHIQKTKQHTTKPFGVNVPLLYSRIEESIQILIDEKVPIVVTSAGNPATYTQRLKDNGITVVHVVANLKFAKKCEEVGVDALVAEGFEAGGHNGREETTTLTLIPLIRENTRLPLIAAGGIGSGRSMLAAMALGADGVQVGTRFVASEESSAHPNFKQQIITASDGATMLSLKKLTPVRLMRNEFWARVAEAEQQGASKEQLLELLGKGRSRRGIFEGDLAEGELEAGQIAALIHDIKPAGDIVREMMREFIEASQNMSLAASMFTKPQL